MRQLVVPEPESVFGEFVDRVLAPCMYILQGDLTEVSQRTYIWNNKKLPSVPTKMDWSQCVQMSACVRAKPRYWCGMPVFHAPLCGGWTEFVVLEPAEPYEKWYVGWAAEDVIGYSQIPLQTPVRMLLGDAPTHFSLLMLMGTNYLYNGKERVGLGRLDVLARCRCCKSYKSSF